MLALLVIGGSLTYKASAQINFDSLWGVWNDTLRDPVDRLRAMSYLSIDGYLHTSRPDSGYLLAVMQYDLAVKVGNERYQGLSLNTQGEYFGMKGNYAAMLDRFERSLEYFERSGDQEAYAKMLSNMGVLLQQLGVRDKAHEFYDRSVELAEKRQDTTSLAAVLINIGSLSLAETDTAKSMASYERAIALLGKGAYDRDLCIAVANMGIIQSYKGNSDEAIALHERSLQLAEALGEDDLRIMVWNNMASHYLRTEQLDRAIELASKAMAVAHPAGLPKEIMDAANHLHKAYAKKGRFKEALQMYQLSEQMEDSLRNDEGRKELQRFNYEKKALSDSLEHAAEMVRVENERTIAELRADRNRNRVWAIGGGALVLLAGGGALFLSDRKRRKERFEKEAATLETQALRSQMNPHFIFNALNSINAYVQQNDQDSASSYLIKFARVMRSVLENSRHSEVPLQDDLDTLRGYMELERKRSLDKFDFEIVVDPALNTQEVMVPPLVVQPFVENAIWHGMAGKEGKGHILLKVEARGTQLLWSVEDDGAGRHAPKAAAPSPTGIPMKKTSLGTAITRSRLDLVQKQHGGKAGFKYIDLPQGTRVEVNMPLLRAH